MGSSNDETSGEEEKKNKVTVSECIPGVCTCALCQEERRAPTKSTVPKNVTYPFGQGPKNRDADDFKGYGKVGGEGF